jgi:hypothetical protein
MCKIGTLHNTRPNKGACWPAHSIHARAVTPVTLMMLHLAAIVYHDCSHAYCTLHGPGNSATETTATNMGNKHNHFRSGWLGKTHTHTHACTPYFCTLSNHHH